MKLRGTDIVTIYLQWEDTLPRVVCRMSRYDWEQEMSIPRLKILELGEVSDVCIHSILYDMVKECAK